MASSLIKTILHKSLAEGVYRDIVTKSSNYYYYLGRTLRWSDENVPPSPIDSYAYERAIRDDIITLKQIGPSDVCFVIPRRNWTSGTIYDMYDDEYSSEVLGINIINGGTGFTTLPTITITGGGSGVDFVQAKFYPIIYNGKIIDIEPVGVADTTRGFGYVSEPTVTVTGGGGTGAVLKAVVNISKSTAAAQKLEESYFYVMTEDYNVYKCLDNNNGALSTVKPLGTSVSPITGSDGYVWKYMYNVPINLRSKFLNDQYIPVVSALTNQFYSNGSLDTIVITNKGTGYTSATLTVSGDGYRESDPIFINEVVISDGGTDYTSPTVTISDPVNNATLFLSSAVVFLGQKIFNSTGDFYEVVSPGTMASSEPTHKFGTVQSGTAAMKYLGTRATATATVVDGVITQVNLIGAVKEINLTNPGSGYTNPPSVNFSGGGGSYATGVAKVNNETGSILYVTITNSGENYTSDPDVIFGEEWTANTSVLIGEQYFYGNYLYTVTAAGTTHATTGPTHTSGAVTNGTATLTYAGLKATGTVTRRYGAGYEITPTISFSEPGHTGDVAAAYFQVSKSEAKLIPVISGGQIVNVIVQDGGIGYSAATITVTGDGDNATLLADLNVGQIQSLQANNEILTTGGTINAIGIISGGYGYGVANINILGDGTGATASATLDSSTGAIKKINITNPGQGYTFATVTVTGNGYGANLRAIMSPYGGHGKNAPDELYARTLMFYSNVSTDLNQGVAVNNDYRQIGILKNPYAYNNTVRYQNNLGSACFIVEGGIDTATFVRDTDIYVNRTIEGTTYKRRYRIVAATASSALIQSLDNDTPLINDTFTKVDTLLTFSITSVGAPTVDKYSGQLMFIDNKAAFTPSADETVTLRTIIQF